MIPVKQLPNIIKDKVQEYISILNDEKDIYNTDCYNGLLSYIGDNVFSGNNSIDLKDINYLNTIFKIYRLYCGKYKQKIYLTGFCLFCNIDFYHISKIVRRDIIVPLDDYMIVLGWVKSSEHSQVTSDSKKSEFLLSTVYGYTEGTTQNAPEQSDQVSRLPVADSVLLPDNLQK